MIVEFAWNGAAVHSIHRVVSGRAREAVRFRYVVDILSLRDCLLSVAALPTNPLFMGVRYAGDLNSLLTFLQEFGSFSVPVSMRYPLPKGDTFESLFGILSTVPLSIRLCIVTPTDFHDLQLVHRISEKFPNVGFCGGSFLKLPGCSFGCISGYPFKQDGVCVSGCPYMNTATDECFWVVSDTDVDFCVEYYSPGVSVVVDVPVEQGFSGGTDDSKRVVSSIADLF